MTSESPTISVVIPTIGRPEVVTAIQSALRQSYPVSEIILVNDDPFQASLETLCAGVVREVRTGGGCGVARARNLGIAAATGDFVALLDDDDLWLMHHTAAAMRQFTEDPDLDVYCCRAFRSSPTGTDISSTVIYRGRQSLDQFWYGRKAFFHRRRTIPTSSIIVKRSSKLDRFDEGLHWQEDTWWLLSNQRRGCRVRQFESIGVVFFSNPTRAAGRITPASAIDWAAIFEGAYPGGGQRYLVGSPARRFALHGQREDFEHVRRVIRERYRPTMTTRGALVVLSVVCRLRLRPALGTDGRAV